MLDRIVIRMRSTLRKNKRKKDCIDRDEARDAHVKLERKPSSCACLPPKGFCTGSPDVKTKDPSIFIACLQLKTGDFRG